MQLNYRKYSDEGPPLLVLHGLFGSQSNWGWHCKQLAEHFQVIGVDLRNHGDSPHSDAHNYPVMAADVLKLMDTLVFDSCYVLGHSMGGKVAMELALLAPMRITKLMVVDIAPVQYNKKMDAHLNVIAGMKSLDLGALTSRSQAEEHLSSYISDEPTRKFVMTNLSRDKEKGFRWRINLPAIEENYDRLREKTQLDATYEGPTLFVKGDLSDYVQAKHESEILALFPKATVKIIVEAGHWVHADKPQAFQKIAQDFFSSTTS